MDVEEEKPSPTNKKNEKCCHEQLFSSVQQRVKSSANQYVNNVTSFGREVSEIYQQIDCKSSLRNVFTVDNLRNKLPITKWIPTYRLSHLQGDLIAGVTVGLMVIPQGLAYAKIAELPPQYGLYTAFMGCFVYTLFGGARDLTYGPTAIMALLTAEFAHGGSVQAAILLTFLSGIIQMAIAVVNIGFIVDYISHPVINSFTTAAAITIICSQFKKLLGLRKIPRGFIPQLLEIFRKLGLVNVYDLLLGLICMATLYAMKKLKETNWAKRQSQSKRERVAKYLVWLTSTGRNAIVVIAATGLSAGLYSHEIKPFSLTGPIVAGIPSFQMPAFEWTEHNVTFTAADNFARIGFGAVFVPVIAITQLVAVGKAFSRKNNYRLDCNQELLALGIANLLGSFVSSFPVTAGFSRSVVNSQSGVQTPAGCAFTGSLVLLALAFLTPLFYFIPDATLAAVIIMAVQDMADFTMVPRLWRVKKIDLLLWLLTFIVSLAVGVEFGLLVGVVLSLLVLLYPWSRPRIKAEVVQLTDGEIAVMTVNFGLLFPSVDHVEREICETAFDGGAGKSVVLNMENVSYIDSTIIEFCHQMKEFFAKKRAKFVLCNVQPEVRDTFVRSQPSGKIDIADTVDQAINIIMNGERQANGHVTCDVESQVIRITPSAVNIPSDDVTSIPDKDDGGRKSAGYDDVIAHVSTSQVDAEQQNSSGQNLRVFCL